MIPVYTLLVNQNTAETKNIITRLSTGEILPLKAREY